MSGDPILIISDIHTRYRVVNLQIQHAEERLGGPVSQVIVLGDFGFFLDAMTDYFRRDKQCFQRPVSTLEGNHEDHGALPDLARQFADSVTHLPRGRLLELEAGRAVCLGGARYMDAGTTPRGSEITNEDVEACLCHDPSKVELILTHDCPSGLGVPGTEGMEHYGSPGEPLLRRLAQHFSPSLWLFGHHHRWFDQTTDGIRFVGLPRSWEGYVLLGGDGSLDKVDNIIDLDLSPWWKRIFRLGG